MIYQIRGASRSRADQEGGNNNPIQWHQLHATIQSNRATRRYYTEGIICFIIQHPVNRKTIDAENSSEYRNFWFFHPIVDVLLGLAHASLNIIAFLRPESLTID